MNLVVPFPKYGHGEEIVAHERRYNPRCPSGGVRICRVTAITYVMVEYDQPVNEWRYELSWNVGAEPIPNLGWATDSETFTERQIDEGIFYEHECHH